MTETATAEVVVIGAGVIGLALAAALARQGREVVIVEAEPAIGTGTSSRNSEVIHAGIYYPEGSLKARLCVAGKALLYDWCARHGIAHRRTGKLIVATTEAEVRALDAFAQRAAAHGVALTALEGTQAQALEPALSCQAALFSPTTGIVDSHGLMLSLLGVAEDHGAALALATPVLGGEPGSGGITLHCGGREPMTLEARLVVNAAGLAAQTVSRALGVEAIRVPPQHLAKGSYFDLTTAPPFSRLVYPLPVDGGLGVHYTVDLGGRGRFGPDVEWLPPETRPDALDYAVAPERGAVFYDAVRRYWPGLPDGTLAPAYAGVRPKLHGPGTAAADFVVHTPSDSGVDGLFTLYGIESPGLTSSLALARHVAELIEEWDR